jgi:hypothetical protein
MSTKQTQAFNRSILDHLVHGLAHKEVAVVEGNRRPTDAVLAVGLFGGGRGNE